MTKAEITKLTELWHKQNRSSNEFDEMLELRDKLVSSIFDSMVNDITEGIA